MRELIGYIKITIVGALLIIGGAFVDMLLG